LTPQTREVILQGFVGLEMFQKEIPRGLDSSEKGGAQKRSAFKVDPHLTKTFHFADKLFL
jgi:hypothetical protein